ncbi:MAG TPA: thioredoxin, partial [Planctomycetes bacterium]|nr:thioredoxin [Planctomycetota bacterium]
MQDSPPAAGISASCDCKKFNQRRECCGRGQQRPRRLPWSPVAPHVPAAPPMEPRLPQANMEVPPMLSLQAAVLALALAAAPTDTVLLEFSAPWCKACRRMGPTLEALRARGYPVRQVDYDRQPQLAAKYRVRLLPTFVMLAEGKVVDRHEG